MIILLIVLICFVEKYIIRSSGFNIFQIWYISEELLLHSLNLEPFIDMIDIHFTGVKLMRFCDILCY